MKPGWQPNRPAAAWLASDIKARARLREILVIVGSECDIDPDLIRGSSRYRGHTGARHIAIWLARNATGLSLPELGKAFGGRHHTSVLYSVRAIDRLRKHHFATKELTDRLLKLVMMARGAPAVPCSTQPREGGKA
jgi:chromosomal replication initiator protein